MIIGVAYVVALLLVATVAVDPGAVADQPDRLFILVGLVLAMAFLTAATVRSERDHRREAALDPLTGLLNRHALIQRLTDYERGAAAGSRIGVLVGDLDHFKRINDEHGHLTGDAVLKDVAEALRGALRMMDLVYRIGGEEFVVVLPGADLDRARGVAERLRETVDSSVGGFELTISFGAAAGEAGAFTDLYRRADAALFAAKRAGRDRVAVAA